MFVGGEYGVTATGRLKVLLVAVDTPQRSALVDALSRPGLGLHVILSSPRDAWRTASREGPGVLVAGALLAATRTIDRTSGHQARSGGVFVAGTTEVETIADALTVAGFAAVQFRHCAPTEFLALLGFGSDYEGRTAPRARRPRRTPSQALVSGARSAHRPSARPLTRPATSTSEIEARARGLVAEAIAAAAVQHYHNECVERAEPVDPDVEWNLREFADLIVHGIAFRHELGIAREQTNRHE